jgi:signal peptidase II
MSTQQTQGADPMRDPSPAPSRASATVTSSKQIRDYRPLFFFLSLVVIALDRATKLWIDKHIAEGLSMTIIPHVFQLTHVLNDGAAFSLFDTAPATPTRWALTSFSLVAAGIMAFIIARIGKRWSMMGLGLALVLGGALGNAWDRIEYKRVTDFLSVRIYHYNWPDFNVADSAILIGGILVFLGALFMPRQTAPAPPAADLHE